MTSRLTISEGHVEPLSRPGSDEREDCHVFDRDSILAVNAALATDRPLLVRGEPGIGKSQLARAVAKILGREFVAEVVDARTESRDLLYNFDAVARLAEAQVHGARYAKFEGQEDKVAGLRVEANAETEFDERLAAHRFVQPGPAWWAMNWNSAEIQAKESRAPVRVRSGDGDNGVVLLLDEIDKADAGVPNGLLQVLGSREFSVPHITEPIAAEGVSPLVIITTNNERVLPDAFVRRCFVLHLTFPPKKNDDPIKFLVDRGKHRFGDRCDDEILKLAAKQLMEDRGQAAKDGLSKPGQAEYFDLLDAVVEQESEFEKQKELLEAIQKFALKKHEGEMSA